MRINSAAVRAMWLREQKCYFRAKSRVIGSVATPLLILAFFGLGFSRLGMEGVPSDVSYLNFLVPGVVGMMLVFRSIMAGMSVLWDKETGFLKQVLVSPVSRLTIVLGQMLGGATTAMVQGIMIFLLAMLFGFRPQGGAWLVVALLFMLLIIATFMGMGLALACRMRDIQGFNLVMSFLVFPFVFLAGVFFPLGNLPPALRYVAYINPLTYGIDGLRAAVTGVATLNLWLDVGVSAAVACLLVAFATYSFGRAHG